MNHPMVDRIERTGSPYKFERPLTKRCKCGCAEIVSTSFAHVLYEEEFYIDIFHVRTHLTNIGVYEERG